MGIAETTQSTATPRLAFVACLYAACSTGSTYGFGLYAGAMQQSLGLSDAALANVNTLPYMLGFVSPPIVGHVFRLCGPALGLFMGGMTTSASQVLLFLIASGVLPTGNIAPPVALVLCAMGVYIGSQFVTAAAFATPVHHFQRKRSRAVSIIKTFVGLSGAVVSQLYVLAFGVPTREPGALRCILLWAAISATTACFGAALVPRRPRPGSAEPALMLKRCFWLLLVLAGCSTAASLAPQEGIAHGVLVSLMLTLALVPIPLALGPLVGLACSGRLGAATGHTTSAIAAVAPLIASEHPAGTAASGGAASVAGVAPADSRLAPGSSAAPAGIYMSIYLYIYIYIYIYTHTHTHTHTHIYIYTYVYIHIYINK